MKLYLFLPVQYSSVGERTVAITAVAADGSQLGSTETYRLMVTGLKQAESHGLFCPETKTQLLFCPRTDTCLVKRLVNADNLIDFLFSILHTISVNFIFGLK